MTICLRISAWRNLKRSRTIQSTISFTSSASRWACRPIATFTSAEFSGRRSCCVPQTTRFLKSPRRLDIWTRFPLFAIFRASWAQRRRNIERNRYVYPLRRKRNRPAAMLQTSFYGGSAKRAEPPYQLPLRYLTAMRRSSSIALVSSFTKCPVVPSGLRRTFLARNGISSAFAPSSAKVMGMPMERRKDS